ncbi:Flp pilus assembly protein TadD [Roseiarcus fermentans]|uniref:Flp pilus assembly protein TadD n=1 Tax=Roseiarcus fermentans TaxID=1473586 RepID=A0A366F7A1_9HYPH|nr:tetratricopeptide repeat protein [Roseiarcus fermentans]RBP09840.1 Flp pilus assembly protein TadD [Roseiarcus fermentans]
MIGHIWRRTLAAGALAAIAFAGVPFAAAAPVPGNPQEEPDFAESQPGNYLAALIASANRDSSAAEAYYMEALRLDPHNPDLIERAFSAALSNGDVSQASALADRLLSHDPTNRLARLALAVNAMQRGDYPTARWQLQSHDAGPRDVTTSLLIAWTYAGQKDLRRALDTLDRIRDPGVAAFRDFHAGLIADQLGAAAEAQRRLKAAYETDRNALRFADAYARFLAAHGDKDGAGRIYAAFAAAAPHNPIVERGLADIAAEQSPKPLVASAGDGAAEVLYGLGAAGIRQGDELPALVYLRLSLFLRPGDDLTAVTLANLFEEMKKDDLAIAAYEAVPATSPLRRDSEIQAALVLDSDGKSDEAIKRLTAIVAARPYDPDALAALAGAQRSAKRYEEAAATYDKAIAAVGIPTRDNWTLFYFRGICYERAKDWPKAEDDFKKALELYPDQPMVLNYLGYSWVDQGVKLDEAFRMLRRAVELRPNDGYIVDSLGWAHYKLGQYSEAAETLEKAVDLKPADPVLNDHLGDAYWHVDRKVEARFQWNHARDMKPEPEDLPAILKKIEVGLPDGAPDRPQPDDAPAKAGGG